MLMSRSKISSFSLVLYIVIGAGAGFALAQAQEQKWSILILVIVATLFVLVYLMGEDRYAKTHQAANRGNNKLEIRNQLGSNEDAPVEILPPDKAREWVDDFLVKQQKGK